MFSFPSKMSKLSQSLPRILTNITVRMSSKCRKGKLFEYSLPSLQCARKFLVQQGGIFWFLQ